MLIDGKLTQDGRGKEHTGIGTFINVDGAIWIFYPVDLSCEDKYVGYVVSSDNTSYHVVTLELLDDKVHMSIRKIRKDRGINKVKRSTWL